MSWCTIESDPGVFSELIQTFGVPNVKVEELYDLDDATFAGLPPVYGLVFLFKHEGRSEVRPDITYDEDAPVYFANQTINNACGTQAILHVLLNSGEVELGPTLGNFKAFTADFPSDLRGSSFNDSPEIRNAHNSFARPEPFMADSSSKGGKKEDAFHFVAYVCVAGQVYELDGLRPAPIRLGAVDAASTWFSVARTEIHRRIEQYAQSEIRFTLLGVCRDVRADLTAAVAEQTRILAQIEVDMASGGTVDGDVLLGRRLECEAELEAAAGTLATENAKFEQYKLENIRRKHNYVPFIVQLFKELAHSHSLLPLLEAAKGRALELRAQSAKRKAAAAAGSGTGGKDSSDDEDSD